MKVRVKRMKKKKGWVVDWVLVLERSRRKQVITFVCVEGSHDIVPRFG